MSEAQTATLESPHQLPADSRFARPAAENSLQRAAAALKEHGIAAYLVDDASGARRKVLELVPAGSEVFTATSETLRSVGLDSEFNERPTYHSLRNSMMKLYQDGKQREAGLLVAAPEYAVGSVHAVTEGGEVLIASRSGSQLGPYLYGAQHVIWVVGAQKIVGGLEAGFQRIHEYALPLEDARARRVYGRGSGVAKVGLVYFDDPGRSSMVLVREPLGF